MAVMKTYSEQIVAHIKNALLEGSLMPGDKVNEVHLAQALSISRAPIREGLQMLVREGLIISLPQRGKFIRALSAQEIRDSYFIGGVLEGAAISGSCQEFLQQDFAYLEALLSGMQQLEEHTKDYAEQLAKLDVAFHEKLLSHSHNKLMVETSRNVCQRISKFLLFRHWPELFSLEEIVDRHEKILEAVKTGHTNHIEDVIREHYSELGERMSRYGKATEEY